MSSVRYSRGNAPGRGDLPEATEFSRWRRAPRDGLGRDRAYAIERIKRRNRIGKHADVFIAILAIGVLIGYWFGRLH